MAIYYLGVKTFGRAKGPEGSVSTSAAAYRSGERIRDERTGAVYDHSRRRDVMHKEILLPSKYDGTGAELDWARNRGQLWNAAEKAEHRSNSRVAREYVLALPHELKSEQRILLAQSFAQDVADRYGSGVDLAVHAPKTDPRNFHAHLLTTTREITPAGLGAKTTLEWNGTRRFEHGLPRYRDEHSAIRDRWAGMANVALREAGLSQRISAVREAGAELQPGTRAWLPRVAWEIEKRGEHSYLGDLVRQRYAQRQQVREAEQDPVKAWAAQRMKQGPLPTPEDGVKAWLAYHAERSAARDKQGHERAPEQARERERSRGLDDDFGL